MISVTDAITTVTNQVHENLPQFATSEASYQNGVHKVLSSDVIVPQDLPPFSRSTVDGYAVKAEDTFGASESLPALLDNKGKISMGETPENKINQEETMEIATGGMLPQESDAVVMLEDVEQFEDGTIMVYRSVAAGENVIQKGEDASEGKKVLTAGTEIRPQDIGALAAMGIKTVSVYECPVVGIISTGDELVSPEEPLADGKIRDINSWVFASSVETLKAQPFLYGIIPDEEENLRATLNKAVNECELVIVSGGSSVGARDLTAKIINELGSPGLLFHGISIKPGKPTMFGMVGETPVFGLSGNPVSAMITFDILVRPAVKILRGINSTTDMFSTSCQAVLTRNVSSSSGREDYIRVSLTQNNEGELEAVPVLGESGLIFTLVEAHGLIKISQNTEGLRAGDTVEVYRI